MRIIISLLYIQPMYKSVLNESEFARARKHFDIIQWYSFWYQWIKKVHDLYEIYMVGIETTLPLLEDMLQNKTTKQNKTNKQDEGLVKCDKLLIHQSFLQQAQTKLVIPDFNNV